MDREETMHMIILETEMPATVRTLLLREQLATFMTLECRHQGGRDLVIIHDCDNPLPQPLATWLACAQGCGLVGKELFSREEAL